MAEHSKIGASSMSRWQNCPGSVALSEGMPNTSSSHAAEGTVAHNIAEFSLNNPFSPIEPNLGAIVPQEGHDIEVTKEMLEAVAVYTDYVQGLESEGGEVLVEQKLHLKDVHPDLFGTADAIVFSEKAKTLTVIDYKHGAGVGVDVENNVQLMYYALGAALQRDFKGFDKVNIAVVQPRYDHPDGPIREWSIPVIDLMEWAEVLKAAAEATDDPKAPTVPGSWCRWCKAKAVCPTLSQEALAAAAVDFKEIKADNGKLAIALSKVAAVETWAKAVREYAYQEATHGREPGGWKLVEKRPTRKWGDKAEAILDLKAYGMDDADIFQERAIKTPPQIEKVIGKKNIGDIQYLIIKKTTGTTLVPESDKRERVKKGPEQDFEKLT